MAFKDNLKKYRELSGDTAKEFSQKAGIAYTTYLTYENQGREPKFDILMKIASLLHISIDTLLGYTPDAPDELTQSINFLKKIGFTVDKYYSKNFEEYFVITSRSFKREEFPYKKPKYLFSKNKNDWHLSFILFKQDLIDFTRRLLMNDAIEKNIEAIYYNEALLGLVNTGFNILEQLRRDYWKNPQEFENDEDISNKRKAEMRDDAIMLQYLRLVRGEDN